MQGSERVFVLHHKRFIAFFNAFGNQAAFNIPAVNEIIFKIPVPPGNQRLANKPTDGKPFVFPMDFYQVGSNVAAIDMVNHFF